MYLKGTVYKASLDGLILAIQIGDQVIDVENDEKVFAPVENPAHLLGSPCAVPAEEQNGKARPMLAAFSGWIDLSPMTKLEDEKLEDFLELNKSAFDIRYTVADVMNVMSQHLPEGSRNTPALASEVGRWMYEREDIYEKIDSCMADEARILLQEEEEGKPCISTFC